MSKTSDRLKDYQTQMSIYAEQHKLILASDVLDMIEQLQDDLKDDVEKVVAELEKMRNEDSQGCKRVQGWKCHSYSDCGLCIMDRTIDIVRKGGVE